MSGSERDGYRTNEEYLASRITALAAERDQLRERLDAHLWEHHHSADRYRAALESIASTEPAWDMGLDANQEAVKAIARTALEEDR